MKWTLLILGTLVITSAGFIAAGQSYDYPHLNLVAEGIEAPDCMDVPKLVVNGGVQCSEQAMDQWLREMRAWRAQRYVHPAAPAGIEPARDHRAVVAYPDVIGMRDGARAFAVALRPDNRDAPGFHRRPDGRVAGELVERLGGHRRGALGPLGRHGCGSLPGRTKLP